MAEALLFPTNHATNTHCENHRMLALPKSIVSYTTLETKSVRMFSAVLLQLHKSLLILYGYLKQHSNCRKLHHASLMRQL